MDRFEQDIPMDPQEIDPQLCELLDAALAPAPQGEAGAMPVDMVDRILILTADADLLDEALSPAALSEPMAYDLVDRIVSLTHQTTLLDAALAPDTVAAAVPADLVERITSLTAQSQLLDDALAPATVAGGMPVDLVSRIAELTQYTHLLTAALGAEALSADMPAALVHRLASLVRAPEYDAQLFDEALGAAALAQGIPAGMVDRILSLTRDAALLDQALAGQGSTEASAQLIARIEGLTAHAALLDEALAPVGMFAAPSGMVDRIAAASISMLAQQATAAQVVDLSREDEELGQPLLFPTGAALAEHTSASAPVAQSIFDTQELFDENATRSLTALLPHLDRRARKSDGSKGLSALLGPKRTRIARQIAAAVILAAEAGIWFTLVTIADDARAIVTIDQELEELAGSSAQLDPMVSDELDAELEQLRSDMLNDHLSNWGANESAPTLDEALRRSDFSLPGTSGDDFQSGR